MNTTSQSLLDSLRPSPTRTDGKPRVRSHRRAHGTGLAVFLAFSAPLAAPQIGQPAFQQSAAVDAACAGAAITRLETAALKPIEVCLAAEDIVDHRYPREAVASAGRQPSIHGMRMVRR